MTQTNSLLRRDVRLLGNLLGEVIISQCGHEVFNDVETIRLAAKNLRSRKDEASRRSFEERIGHIPMDTGGRLSVRFRFTLNLSTLQNKIMGFEGEGNMSLNLKNKTYLPRPVELSGMP